jgi:hypothetical protein
MHLSMIHIRVFAPILLILLSLPVLATAGSVTAGSVNGTSGSTTLVPIILADANPMYRLDLTLSYDPKICTAVDVLPGDFTLNTTLTSALDRGEIRVTLTSLDGIGGDGVLAWIRFRVLAPSGSSTIRVLSARSTPPLEKRDGTLSIIPGIAFSRTSEGRQRVTVDLGESEASITGDTITFSDGGMQIRIRTEGIGATSTLASGLVHNVTMTSPSAALALDSGTVEGSYALVFSEYPSEGTFFLSLSTAPSPTFQDAIREATDASKLNLTALSFVAKSSVHGVSVSGPVTFSFTLPSKLAPGVNQTYRLATREGEGLMSLRAQTYTDSGEGTLSIVATLPRFPSELALLTVKEGPRPAMVTSTYTQGSILSSGTESAGGSIWVGMITFFFLVAIVVVAVLFVHRQRGG